MEEEESQEEVSRDFYLDLRLGSLLDLYKKSGKDLQNCHRGTDSDRALQTQDSLLAQKQEQFFKQRIFGIEKAIYAHYEAYLEEVKGDHNHEAFRHIKGYEDQLKHLVLHENKLMSHYQKSDT